MYLHEASCVKIYTSKPKRASNFIKTQSWVKTTTLNNYGFTLIEDCRLKRFKKGCVSKNDGS